MPDAPKPVRPQPSPEQLSTRMHEPVTEAARITVGHADEAEPERQYDLTGRDNRVIQAAIDTVAALNAGDAARIVEIGPGTFLMRDSLHLRSHVTIRGTPGKTVLVKAPAAKSRLALDGDYGEEQITVADPAGFEVAAASPSGTTTFATSTSPSRGSRAAPPRPTPSRSTCRCGATAW